MFSGSKNSHLVYLNLTPIYDLVPKILENSKKIVDVILSSTEFSYSLLEYKKENDIYNHSVRVAAFASVLAKYYNKELFKKYNDFETLKNQKINIESLTTAALAHDLGKTFKDKKFNIKISKLPDVFKEKLPGITNINLDLIYKRFGLERKKESSSKIKPTTINKEESVKVKKK